MASIEVKIKKLDGELARYKEQMSKLRNGPGKVRLPSTAKQAITDPTQSAFHVIECDTRARPSYSQAEAHV